MAKNVAVGDTVMVPISHLGLDNAPYALLSCDVLQKQGRTVLVNSSMLTNPTTVATRLVHADLGILVLSIGDFFSEETLIRPLSKSILQFLRLLLPDDRVVLLHLRSRDEMRVIWEQQHAAYSHVLLIAHGSGQGIYFGADEAWLGPDEIAEELAGSSQKTFLSLSCRTGCASFARQFSGAPCCSALIAPFQSLHGAAASQFCQSYYSAHFLDGMVAKRAFNLANNRLPKRTSFRYWQNGSMT